MLCKCCVSAVLVRRAHTLRKLLDYTRAIASADSTVEIVIRITLGKVSGDSDCRSCVSEAMDHIERMFPFYLVDNKWFQFSIVSVPQSNPSPGGGSKSPALSMNGAVSKGEEAGDKAALSRFRSHIPDAEEMRTVFEKLDVNKDGVICSDELSGFMEKLGFKMSPEEVQSLVKTVDQNSDGEVDFDEFYALYSSLTGAESKQSESDDKADEKEHEENLKQAFRVFDKDNDGFITVKELQSVLLSLGLQEGRSLIKCQQMIKGVDVDGNGKVDFQEFKKLMSSDVFQS